MVRHCVHHNSKILLLNDRSIIIAWSDPGKDLSGNKFDRSFISVCPSQSVCYPRGCLTDRKGNWARKNSPCFKWCCLGVAMGGEIEVWRTFHDTESFLRYFSTRVRGRRRSIYLDNSDQISARECWQSLGHTYAGIDATHNTTHYENMSLFTLMVQDKWGHGEP